MFAGPNGSGKSTMKALLPPELVGIYVNADDIERGIRDEEGHLDLAPFGLVAVARDLPAFFASSTLLASAGLREAASAIAVTGARVDFTAVDLKSYHAAVTADFIRRNLLAARATFTFETVMSAHDKVEFLGEAQAAGYRTFLYFVATDDPMINVARVRRRVAGGGHDVPEDKIVERYDRSLANLAGAVRGASRAYIFDNSGPKLQLLAEVADGRKVVVRQERLPHWFDTALPTG
jgi:predicted ABC-type ATPase